MEIVALCYLWENNKNVEPDLTNVAREETVDKCFDSATPRLKLLSMEEILLRKLLESKVKIRNGESFVKGESLHLFLKSAPTKFQKVLMP